MKSILFSLSMFFSVHCFSQVISSGKIIGVWSSPDSLYPNNYTLSFPDSINAIVIGENNSYKGIYTIECIKNKTLLTINGNKRLPSLQNPIVKKRTLRFLIDSISDNTLKLEVLDKKDSILGCSTLTRKFVVR